MGQDAALQIGVKLPLDIGRQAGGIGVRVQGGEKGLEMVGNDVIEHGATGVTGFVGRKSRRHMCLLRTASRGWI